MSHGNASKPGASAAAPKSPNAHSAVFPLRAKPEFYQQALQRILTRAETQAACFKQLRAVVEKVEEAQNHALGREMTEPERRTLEMRTLRDLRNSLLALGAAIGAVRENTAEHIRRTHNAQYLQWRIEKEILSMHWGVKLWEIDDRQLRSGMRMPRFLTDSIESEGLN